MGWIFQKLVFCVSRGPVLQKTEWIVTELKSLEDDRKHHLRYRAGSIDLAYGKKQDYAKGLFSMKETKNPGCSMLGKLVIYDIKCGRGYTYSACLVPFLLIGFNCLILRNQVISLTAYSGTAWKTSSADFLFSFMKGQPILHGLSAETSEKLLPQRLRQDCCTYGGMM